MASSRSNEGRSILYITYDGLTDPLGRSQVLPYLTGLAAMGHRITILSCEKRDRWKSDGPAVQKLCDQAALFWAPIAYHRRPPVLSAAYDTAMLARRAAVLHRERQFEIVHCRSYIPVIVGLHLKKRYGLKLIFDMRGYWAEEKVESGNWPLRNPLFRAVFDYFKREEADALIRADAIVSLTRASRHELAGRPELKDGPEKIAVIPTCVDFDHFALATQAGRKKARQQLGIPHDTPVLGYVGSVGGDNYMLGEMLEFFRAYREKRPGACFLFITQVDPQLIIAAAREKDIGEDCLLIRAARRDEVPFFTSAADHGVAFKRATFSALACSPTKLGEMMALGIPVAANSGVGDVTEILAETGGVTIDRFDRQSLSAAVGRLISTEMTPKTIRDRARTRFDLRNGVRAYDQIYRSVVT